MGTHGFSPWPCHHPGWWKSPFTACPFSLSALPFGAYVCFRVYFNGQEREHGIGLAGIRGQNLRFQRQFFHTSYDDRRKLSNTYFLQIQHSTTETQCLCLLHVRITLVSIDSQPIFNCSVCELFSFLALLFFLPTPTPGKFSS